MKRTLLACLLLATSLITQAQHPDTPLMGWNSWNTYAHHISDSLILSQAQAMVSTGLKAAGYTYMNIDDGYFGGRQADGRLVIHPTRFPGGMKAVVDGIHALGLKAGIYSDAGRNTCANYFGGDTIGVGVGLYGHDQQDADLFFKELGFDFIKVDFCGGAARNNSENLVLNERERYTDFMQAIRNTGRKDVRMNVCRWAYPGNWVEGVAGSWRTTGDIYLGWKSVRDIVAENLYLSAYSGRGGFNDMDMLEVGRGLTEEEDKTHFGLWCIMNSPLIIGCDMRTISPEALALQTNPELIAVNQDKTFQQAYVFGYQKGCFLLVRDVEKLGGKTRVAAAYNPTDEEQTVEFCLRDIDLDGQATLRDLFLRQDATATVYDPATRRVRLTLPAHGTRIYKVKAARRLERIRYEAETAYNPSFQELKNPQSERTGLFEYDEACSGGLKATWLGRNERNALHFHNVESRNGGRHTLSVACLTPDARRCFVYVDGTLAGDFTAQPGKPHLATLDIPLRKGRNEIVLRNPLDFMPDVDYVEVKPRG